METRRSSFEYEDLLACGRGELFQGGPQLPLPPMLMFDRISEIAEAGGEYDKGVVRAVLNVRPDFWFFPCHFKGDPVMPGCLGLDALWQMIGFYLGWTGGAGPGPAPRPRGLKVFGPGAAYRAQDRVQRRHQTRDAFKACAGGRRRVAFYRWRDYLSSQGPEGRFVQAGLPVGPGNMSGSSGRRGRWWLDGHHSQRQRQARRS